MVFGGLPERASSGLLDVARGLEAEAAHAGRSLRRRHPAADGPAARRQRAHGLSGRLQQPAVGTKALLDRVPQGEAKEGGGEHRLDTTGRGSVRVGVVGLVLRYQEGSSMSVYNIICNIVIIV